MMLLLLLFSTVCIFVQASQTISAAAFQYTNDAHTMPMFVYAISYDWHKVVLLLLCSFVFFLYLCIKNLIFDSEC